MYIICCLSFAVFFLIFFLHILIFFSLLYVFQYVPPWIYSVWDSVHFLDLIFFLSYIREVFIYKLLKYFLRPFLFSFWDPYRTNAASVECQMLSQRSVRLSSILFILFSLYCLVAVISSNLSSRSLICSSASVIFAMDSF